ncbi:MAG: zinc ribbon domain-containing protein [Gammaproteobacteria bacterium]|nr:zinc ribbon domain-containing protein [Gammaproteobacteria bacterium]
MPTYDYQCDANGQTVEVRHGMNELLKNWGELCDKAGIVTGDTPVDSPVRKLATGGNVVKSSSAGSGDLPPCASGGCNGGMCGLG